MTGLRIPQPYRAYLFVSVHIVRERACYDMIMIVELATTLGEPLLGTGNGAINILVRPYNSHLP